jgi:hypothetical protein
MREGQLNDHCVGGYVNKLSVSLRIFTIIYKDLHFTTEFRYSSNGWYINQCKSYQNSEIIDYDSDVVNRINTVCEYLLTELTNVYNPNKAKKYYDSIEESN